MLTKSIASFALVLALPASLPAAAQTKSKVLNTWRQATILMNGKPLDRPSDVPRGAISGENILKISLKGQKVTVKTEILMPFPGQAPMTMHSDSKTFDLAAPGKHRLINGGPEYATSAILDDRSLTVIYNDLQTGELVTKQLWTLDETSSQLLATSDSPGSSACLSTREVDPAKPLGDLRALKGDDCKPAGAIVRVYQRR